MAISCRLSLLSLLTLFSIPSWGQATREMYLSGTGSDRTVTWDFFCTDGRGSGEWTRIAVPSCWEMRGFGQYTYGHMPQKDRLNESGLYRHTFQVPACWRGDHVELVFEGVMTDATAYLNGKQVGEKHQGGYCEFKYEVSRLLRYGKENLLEVRVDKSSSDPSVVRAEREADFWVMGGIFRPVRLRALPQKSIRDMGIDASWKGDLTLELETPAGLEGAFLEADVRTLDGEDVLRIPAASVSASGMTTLRAHLAQPRLWSAEYPNLYEVEVRLVQGGQVMHRVSGRFGFRTLEIRKGSGLFLNGERIKFKGVNRHAHHPETGRTLSDSINLEDALLIKQMNMNAVRMSHYPPDRRFLDLCDSLGLYVIDELTGWQAAYDTPVGRKLVRELVQRDRNHPCVLLWANGNEGGFNFDLVEEFSRWDLQKRRVIHPWLEEEDLCTFHYPTYEALQKHLAMSRKIFFPTEFLHGLYDGGHGAGLQDYWDLMQSHPLSAGGFLWDFADQGLVRTDLEGEMDTDGDHGADGILGPYRQKEGSFYAIRDIWSPIQILEASFLAPGWDGSLLIENRYSFTDLEDCDLAARLRKTDYLTGLEDSLEVAFSRKPSAAPGLRDRVHLLLPGDFGKWTFLEVRGTDPQGREVLLWTAPIQSAEDYAADLTRRTDGATRALLSPQGVLSGLESKGRTLSLTGLRLSSGSGSQKNGVTIENLENGWVEVTYSYGQGGYFDHVGVTMDYPQEKVLGIHYLGDGPYRTWKNRPRGVHTGLWDLQANDTRTGETWDYPEFRGFRSHMYAAGIRTTEGTLEIVFATDDLYLHLLTPTPEWGRSNDHTLGVFPDGSISVLSAISPVGTKFSTAQQTGPMGQKNHLIGENARIRPKTGRFFLRFIP